MKKRFSLVLLLALLLLACRFSSGPNISPSRTCQPGGIIVTSTAIAPTPTPELNLPVAPGQELSLQDPMISDPNAGQAKFRLMELGYDICTITTDFYNYQIEAAVRQFQAAAGLTPNGVLDSVTLERLLAADAPTLPAISPTPLNTSDSFFVEAGESFVVTSDSFWILQGSYFYQFSSQNGEFLGFYQVEPLPGEEIYVPTAAVYAGGTLWIAQQGPEDAIAQAYDLETANPVDGLLKPVSAQSIHFPSMQLYPAAAFDGQNIWFLTDNLQQQTLFLQPVNIDSGTTGTPIRVGASSGFGNGYGIAPDPATGTLWVTYADEVFGEQAIVAVDPATGNVGPALGPCGLSVTYSMSRLWFVNQQGLWSFNQTDGKRRLYDFGAGEPITLAANSENLWLMDSNGTIVKVEAP